MKILFIGLKHEYGKPAWGLSFEYRNFFQTLVAMDNGRHQVELFAIDEELVQHGYEGMNRKLLEQVRSTCPDVCFFFLFTDEIFPATIATLTREGFCTFNWFADDHWRWFNFTRQYAPLFRWCATTDAETFARMQRLKMRGALLTQWAAPSCISNEAAFKKTATLPISFVGQNYGQRARLIAGLEGKGYPVACFGSGWPNGRVSQERMQEIFQTSAINVNFSGSSAVWSLRSVGRIFAHKQRGKLAFSSPLTWVANARSEYARVTNRQLKGRLFEVPAQGGFLLTEYAPHLEEYYALDTEVGVFRAPRELEEKVRFFLEHPDIRLQAAQAAYERTKREHTYEQRFRCIFTQMGCAL